MESTPTIINTSFFRITENPTDIFQINPFDINGNLLKRVNIEIAVSPEIWNGNIFLIYMPTIESLNGNLDFEVNITNFTLPSPIDSPFIMTSGNDFDSWNGTDSVLTTTGSVNWKPQSFDSVDNYGWWLVSSTNSYSPPALAKAKGETTTDWKGETIK